MLLVLTGADAVADKLGALTSHLMPEDFGAPKGHRTFQPLLVADRVRHVGDRVAFVVAETLTQARDAAELVEVDYEPLPALVNIEDAAKPDAPKVWDDNPAGNNAFRLMFGNKEATDAAFARPSTSSSSASRTTGCRPSRWSRASPSATTASDRRDYTLYAASQNPHGAAHGALAHLPRAGEPDPRGVARRRRRLRPEGRLLPRRCVWSCGRRRSCAAR